MWAKWKKEVTMCKWKIMETKWGKERLGANVKWWRQSWERRN